MPAYFAVPNISEQGFEGLGRNQLAWANQVNTVLSEEERARQYWQQAKAQEAQVARQNEALAYNRRAANIQAQDVVRQNAMAQQQRQREIAQQMQLDREQMASRAGQYFTQQTARDAAQQALQEQRAQKANFNQVLRMTEAGIYKAPQDIPPHIEQTLTTEQRGFLSPYFQQQEKNTAQSTGDLGLLKEVALAARRQKEIDSRTFKLKTAKEKINQKDAITMAVGQLPEDKLPVLDGAETALAIKTWRTQKVLPAEARNYFGTPATSTTNTPVIATVAPTVAAPVVIAPPVPVFKNTTLEDIRKAREAVAKAQQEKPVRDTDSTWNYEQRERKVGEALDKLKQAMDNYLPPKEKRVVGKIYTIGGKKRRWQGTNWSIETY